ncbi:hypothetical protein L3X38_019678 [Prunus dulcis]|uniref:Uncharacterized protein n=1 Tax=Prunus dulcis TaxID=3755 RepID=A0AAD4ZC95_PRUDU|nr:hypothetical protein L3X38_019678 [Prunus dulcis]
MSSFSASTKPNFHLVPYRFDSSFCHVRALSKRAGSAIGGGRTLCFCVKKFSGALMAVWDFQGFVGGFGFALEVGFGWRFI